MDKVEYAYALHCVYEKHKDNFLRVFHQHLNKFWDPLFAFDAIGFDEKFIQPPDGISTYQETERKFGKEGADLIKNIINDTISEIKKLREKNENSKRTQQSGIKSHKGSDSRG